MRPAFRLLAICGSTGEIDRVVEIVAQGLVPTLGMVLRDPEHRRDVTHELVDHSLALPLPDAIVPIPSGHRHPSLSTLHLTSRQLRAPFDRGELRFVSGAVHDRRELALAEGLGLDAVVASPIFATPSKSGLPGRGLGWLREIVTSTSLPVFALGGIDAERSADLLEAGAWGLASIRLFHPDRADALGRIVEQLEHHS